MADEAIRKIIIDKLRAGVKAADVARQLNVSRKRVSVTKKLFETTGDIKKRYGGGPKRTKRTKAVVRAVKGKVERNPRRSIRKLAKEHNMGATTMRRLVKIDLGFKSRAIVTKSRISLEQKGKRLERARRILCWLKNGRNAGKVVIFSDEKLFYLDPSLNRRNNRYISGLRAEEVDDLVRYNPKTKHSGKVMVLGVVASDGKKCPIVFVDSQEKINAVKYQQLLEKHVIPWLTLEYPEGNYCFQQDGAPAHTARTTQRFLKEHMVEVWDKEMWPPSSPDLSPLDFSIWSVLDADACKKSHPNLAALKASIVQSWTRMSEDYVHKVCGSFRKRVETVIAKDGGYIE